MGVIGDVVSGVQDAAKDVAEEAGVEDEVDAAEDAIQEKTGIDLGGSGGGKNDSDVDKQGDADPGNRGDQKSVLSGTVTDRDTGGSGGGSGGSGGSGSRSGSGRSGASVSGSGSSGGSSGGLPPGLKPGSTPGKGKTPNINETEARDRDIVNNDFAKTGGNLFENPAERALSNALNQGRNPNNINQAMNQNLQERQAETILQSKNQIQKAQDRREKLEEQLDRLQEGPTRQERLKQLRDRKQDVLEKSEETGAVYDTTELNQAISSLENSEGIYTIQTTNAEGETTTETVSREEAVNRLQNAQNSLKNDISRLRDTQREGVQNLFSLNNQASGGSSSEGSGGGFFASLTGESQASSGGQNRFQGGGAQYRANPGAIKKIGELREQLDNSVMPQSQREDIQNRIDELQRQARQPAEQPGGTDIPGQTPYSRLDLPESAQDREVIRYDPVSKTVRGIENRVEQFQSRPEPRDVENVELSDDLATQAFAAVDTLASKEGFTYLASTVPGGTSPEEVSERSIERRLENPKSGPGQVAEAAISSPVGLVATGAAGRVVGAGAKAASVIGGTRLATAAKAGGAALTGAYVGSQGAKVQKLASQGETTRAGGEALRTVGELGAFGEGYRAFQRYDSPQVLRTTASQADNTLRKVDDELVGSGRMTATTNFKRGPFSRKVLGMDETGTIDTKVNYRVSADETGAEAQGVLTQELPDNADDLRKQLQAKSIVKSSGTDSQGRKASITRDIVRTEQEGTLFRSTNEFTDTSINRRVDNERVGQVVAQGDTLRTPETGDSFVNPNPTREGIRLEAPVDGQVSRFESTSVGPGNPPREGFGESRNLVLADEAGSGGSGGALAGGSNNGGQKFTTLQELGGYPGGSPVNQRGLVDQARASAREALSPNTGGYEVLSGGSGVGIGREAASSAFTDDGQMARTSTAGSVEMDGQRSFQGAGGQEQNFQAGSQELEFQRDRLQSQTFEEGGQAQALERVDVETQGQMDTRGGQVETSITGQLEDSGGSNVERIRRTPAGSVELDNRGSVDNDVTPGRISRVRERVAARGRTGQVPRVDQRGRSDTDLDQGQFSVPGVTTVPRTSFTTAQIPRFQTKQFQFSRNRLDLSRTPGPSTPRTTGRPGGGVPGFDLEGEVSIDPSGADGGTAQVSSAEADLTYDLLSANRVETSTGEQARFQSGKSFREKQFQKQEQLGAFTRNKPVQAQNLNSQTLNTKRREFF